MQRRLAFTLIELLVVVAIIVALLAILMPSLNKAARTAEKTVCLSNLKQLALADQMYAADHFGVLMAADWSAPDHWTAKLMPYLGSASSAIDPATGKTTVQALICPTAPVPANTGVFVAGTATSGWIWPTVSVTGSSYGINEWIQIPGIIAASAPAQYPEADSFVSLKRVASPSNSPSFADANWLGGWPDDTDPPPTNLQTGNSPFTPSNPGMPRFCLDRHDMAINVAMIDGSAHRVKLGDLWALKWHMNFKTGSIVVP